MATLASISFTMSIFISEIASVTNLQILKLVKILILLSTLISCLVTTVVINYTSIFL
ncbi:Na+/H+ antiporter NhaA [Clostridium paraputrificum]|uniref:Na+/H+ antiporter NhaA n=1 Tax=Clostridium paraputrificum TaxID=29363 RepID=UPI0018985356